MIPHSALQRAFTLALPLVLAGCAIAPAPTPPGDKAAPLPAQATTRVFHDTIDFGGRLSARYQNGLKEEALHGSFTWTQTPAQTKVTLLSPLGQTIAIIDVTPLGATLMQGGQPSRSAADVDTLTADAFGWPLPVAGLRDWLQGFAIDRTGQRFIAAPDTAQVVTRDGWQIRYASWYDDAASSSQRRPKRIDLARFTEQAGNVSIRIVIDSWQAH